MQVWRHAGRDSEASGSREGEDRVPLGGVRGERQGEGAGQGTLGRGGCCRKTVCSGEVWRGPWLH